MTAKTSADRFAARHRAERQYLISVDGLVATFECARAGHVYRQDFGKNPVPKRPSEFWLRRCLTYWSRENGGCSGPCPKCERERRAANRKETT